MGDMRDLKSLGPKGPCEFESRLGYKKSFGYFKKLPNFALAKMLFENIHLVME